MCPSGNSQTSLKFTIFIISLQVEMDSAVGDASPHIANMGRMIEVMNAFVNYQFCMYVSCNILM